jgi:hypothetical protein
MSDRIPRPPREGQELPARLRLVHPSPPRTPKQKRSQPTFTPEEEARIRASLRTARRLFGTWACLADALHMTMGGVIDTVGGKHHVSGDVAVRLSKALGVPLESLYRPPSDASTCPHCGAKRAP